MADLVGQGRVSVSFDRRRTISTLACHPAWSGLECRLQPLIMIGGGVERRRCAQQATSARGADDSCRTEQAPLTGLSLTSAALPAFCRSSLHLAWEGISARSSNGLRRVMPNRYFGGKIVVPLQPRFTLNVPIEEGKAIHEPFFRTCREGANGPKSGLSCLDDARVRAAGHRRRTTALDHRPWPNAPPPVKDWS